MITSKKLTFTKTVIKETGETTETDETTGIGETTETGEIMETGDFVRSTTTQVQLIYIEGKGTGDVEKVKERICDGEGERDGDTDILSKVKGTVRRLSYIETININISIENQILLAIEELRNPPEKGTECQGTAVYDLNFLLKSPSLSLSSLPAAKISVFTGVNDEVKILNNLKT